MWNSIIKEGRKCGSDCQDGHVLMWTKSFVSQERARHCTGWVQQSIMSARCSMPSHVGSCPALCTSERFPWQFILTHTHTRACTRDSYSQGKYLQPTSLLYLWVNSQTTLNLLSYWNFLWVHTDTKKWLNESVNGKYKTNLPHRRILRSLSKHSLIKKDLLSPPPMGHALWVTHRWGMLGDILPNRTV